MMTTFVTYARVSTKQQGDAHGLDAQRSTLARFTSEGTVIEAFVEIETGTAKRSRPVLQAAVTRAKVSGATLVIAKIDRLARNVAFTSALMDSGVDFVCCDMPNANRLTLHIMAAMAEHEAEMISERTKAGLQAAKEKGVVLGGWRGKYTKRESKRTLPEAVVRQMQQLRSDGLTLQKIAERLNDQGLRTIRDKSFSKVSVMRTLDREEVLV